MGKKKVQQATFKDLIAKKIQKEKILNTKINIMNYKKK